MLLVQEKHLDEKTWWLNLHQDKQNLESLGEETGAFAAPIIKDICPANTKQSKEFH